MQNGTLRHIPLYNIALLTRFVKRFSRFLLELCGLQKRKLLFIYIYRRLVVKTTNPESQTRMNIWLEPQHLLIYKGKTLIGSYG